LANNRNQLRSFTIITSITIIEYFVAENQ